VKRKRQARQNVPNDEQRDSYVEGVRKERAVLAAEGREEDVAYCNQEIARALGVSVESVVRDAPAVEPEGEPDVVPDTATWPPHPSAVNAGSIAKPESHTEMRLSPDQALGLLALVDDEIDRLGVRGAPLCQRGPLEQVLPAIRNDLCRAMMSAHPGRLYPAGERSPLNPGWQRTAEGYEHDDWVGFDDGDKVRPVKNVDGRLDIHDPVVRREEERIARERRKRAEAQGHV
jgi:hypothetical protein